MGSPSRSDGPEPHPRRFRWLPVETFVNTGPNEQTEPSDRGDHVNRPGLRTQLIVFSALFAAGMWMSKVAQPLYFADRGALAAFGAGYAAMAIAGGFSFAFGALADRIGGLTAVRIGTVVYAIGIAGRVMTDLVPAIGFSVIAGVGASLALVGIRPWIRSTVSGDDVSTVVGGRNLGNQIGMFAGTIGAAGLFALAGQADAGNVTALLVAPGLVLLGALWLLAVGRKDLPVAATAYPTRAERAPRLLGLATKLGIVGVMSGFYVSLITPFVPLYLTRSGATSSTAAIVVAAMSVAQLVTSAVLAKRRTGDRPFTLFLVTELAAGLLAVALAFALSSSAVVVAAVLIARAAFVSIAVIAEETIQYAVIPGNAAGFVFGISQTAFLVGDALGGAVGGPLRQAAGPIWLAVTAGGVTIVNAFAMPLLLHRRRSPA